MLKPSSQLPKLDRDSLPGSAAGDSLPLGKDALEDGTDVVRVSQPPSKDVGKVIANVSRPSSLSPENTSPCDVECCDADTRPYRWQGPFQRLFSFLDT